MRDLPERFGSGKTLYERHRRWSDDGTDGFQGLVHTSELDASSRDVVEVGNALTVKIIEVDLVRRRIVLSPVQALTSTTEGQPCD